MNIRPPSAEELVFVRSSWLKSYATSDWARMLTPADDWRQGSASDDYYDGHRALIAELSHRVPVLIAEDGIVQGWACGQLGATTGPVLHYVYVRQSARKQGLARKLVEALGLGQLAAVEYTHRSRGLDAGRLPRGWRFDPYRLIAAKVAA